MKAMLLEKPGKLMMTEREKPVCGESDLLIKVKACNICKTDLKCASLGQRDLVYPRVLGHEIAGEIVEIGKNIVDYEIGQKVFIHPGIACGECEYCQKGLDNLCDNIKIVGFNIDGGFQEYIKITAAEINKNMIHVINSPNLTFDEISFIEPLACCVNIQDQLKIKKDESLLIIGGGRLGLLNFLLAKANQINDVYLLENNKSRLEFSEKLGFSGVFESESEMMEALSNQAGVDVVIPCCPDPKAMDSALALIKKKGRLGYFSGIVQDQDKPIAFNNIHYKEIEVVGAYGCSQAHTRKAQLLLETGNVAVKELISNRISLENLEQGFENIKNYHGISTIVEF
ncbi:alcohol dehydrogenase catalytic domain-containing protein [Eubacteriaceae bacterium ES2]|nr:alcohol dehydrogenase catalytic domain-containing protein [Eubacteriaceae bacterium ES2]